MNAVGGFRFITEQYNAVSYSAGRSQIVDAGQTCNTQNTTDSSPVTASYGSSIVSTMERESVALPVRPLCALAGISQQPHSRSAQSLREAGLHKIWSCMCST